MNETEKRASLTLDEARWLKSDLNCRYTRKSVVRRTVVVKVENADFSANPDVLIDIKAKLIGDQAVLSVKHGSWHDAVTRQEHEVRFRPEDLGNVLAILNLLGYSRFVVLMTTRTTWTTEGAVITLDEYGKIGQALFEVELVDGNSSKEFLIDEIFAAAGIKPMDSGQTVEFIGGLNRVKAIQVDLETTTATDLAAELLAEHAR
jgi:adenylate cyclase class IV